MTKTCPYHGRLQPCFKCLVAQMGEFARYKPRTGECPYHSKKHPCEDCFNNNMGEFAHGQAAAPAAYVPPHRRGQAAEAAASAQSPRTPIHFRQVGRDTCAIACCRMVGATLDCLRFVGTDELKDYMTERGIYCPGQQSFFHALDYALKWLGLNCEWQENVGLTEIGEIVTRGSLVIMETSRHVIVIFSKNANGTFVIGDPSMSKVETVDAVDYRLKGTGRIWKIWK